MTSTATASARQVRPFEAALLRILHGCLARDLRGSVAAVVVQPNPRPAKLSRTAVDLIVDTLKKGSTRWLAAEAWRCETAIDAAGARTTGRLWERTDPRQLGLSFSPQSLNFLIWLTATDFSKVTAPWKPTSTEAAKKETKEGEPNAGWQLATGDLFLLFLVFRALHTTEFAKQWAKSPTFASHGLCRLVFPIEFAAASELAPADFAPWMTLPGVAVLQSMGREISERLITVEQQKQYVTSPAELRSIGASQQKSFEAFLHAIDRAGRRDLAWPLLAAVRRMSDAVLNDEHWFARVHFGEAKLADRFETQRASLTLWRQMETLQRWNVESRNVGYFDDGYAAAQHYKELWEKWSGDHYYDVSRRILRRAEL